MVEIPWYYEDPRFTPGTVADVGYAFRLSLEKTKRRQGPNKWRLHLLVRTLEKHGVKDDLKRGVCVAQFDGALPLEEAQKKAGEYLCDFLQTIVVALSEV